MSHSGDLFAFGEAAAPWAETMAPGALLLHGFALDDIEDIAGALQAIESRAPFRHMTTPGGHEMSAAMTACGDWGWVTDPSGYRYSRTDPETRHPWPRMPDVFRRLAMQAAKAGGYPHFEPDAGLINRYGPGARMGLHQDRNEKDYDAPIVSVSLGLPMTFLFGGMQRNERPVRYPLVHGDVVVWGGPSRLRYHGVAPLKAGRHPFAGECRINLTFRKAA